MRKKFLWRRVIFIRESILVVFVCFLLSGMAWAQTEAEPADNFQLQTYLTEEQALALVFPECDEIITDEFMMSPDEKQYLEKLLNRRLYEDGFKVYIGKKNDVVLGYAIITEEIGKFHPFTFIVGVKQDGKISEVAVLVYRESRGGEIVKKRFLNQFAGKSFKNQIRINKDIINITGATMSVQFMCAGVRKALAVVEEYYLNGKRDGGVRQEKSVKSMPKSQTTGIATKDDSSADTKLLKETRMIMGTFAEVSIYSDDEKTAGIAIEEALNELNRMDGIMSNYKKNSELSQLNAKAFKSPVSCSEELFDVIEQSQFYSELSDGAFDITVSPFVDAWGFFSEKGRIPTEEEIKKLLSTVSYKNIVTNSVSGKKKAGTVSFKNSKTKIDLGAIGKGYAVDKALDVVKKYKVDNACINLGGNIYVMGVPAGRNAWKIGVQHPRDKTKLLGYLELKDEATATSGDYERFFEIDGKRYSHIINPRTGKPVTGTIAVTIVAPTGTEVDALSTSIFVLGPEKGLRIIKEIAGADAMIAYEKNGEIVIDMTKGFKNKFTKIEGEGDADVRWHVVASDQ